MEKLICNNKLMDSMHADEVNKKMLQRMAKRDHLDNVYSYINNKSAEKPIKVSDLTSNTIYEHFKNQGLTKRDIDDVLDKLMRDQSIVIKHLKYLIYIPPERLENLAPEDKRQITLHELWKLGVGLYFVMFMTLVFPSIPQYIINFFRITTIQNAFLIFVLLGVTLSYIIGTIIIKYLKKLREKIPLIKQYQTVVVPFFLFFIPISIIYGVLIYTLKEKITTTAILTIIGISVAGQVGYWHFLKTKKYNQTQQ